MILYWQLTDYDLEAEYTLYKVHYVCSSKVVCVTAEPTEWSQR